MKLAVGLFRIQGRRVPLCETCKNMVRAVALRRFDAGEEHECRRCKAREDVSEREAIKSEGSSA